ncbi:MAG: D-2-hydroxyacid dehydrogenase [Verrucomicrobiota bacterium]
MFDPHRPAIVFLDADTVGDDIDLSALRQLGDFKAYPTTQPEERAGRIKEAEIVLTNKVVIDRKAMQEAERLRLICVCATGVNNVDLTAAEEQRIAVCNVSGYSTESVTQHTMALLLNLATNAHQHAKEITKWPHSPIFTSHDYPVVEIAGKTLGIVGAGAIGSAVGRSAESLGMDVQTLARNQANLKKPSNHSWPRVGSEPFFQTSDVVSLHCPLNDQTRHLINARTLSLMKADAFLINTGRGELIDESALAKALKEKRLGGAALDVLSEEPPPSNHPLLAPGIPNLLITPHTAWLSKQARTRLMEEVAANVTAFLAGSPQNLVTPLPP